jgi:hypothetical protein
VGLGAATSYAVLAGATVTNVVVPPVSNTVVNGDLGLSPGSSAPGFPPGVVHGSTSPMPPPFRLSPT